MNGENYDVDSRSNERNATRKSVTAWAFLWEAMVPSDARSGVILSNGSTRVHRKFWSTPDFPHLAPFSGSCQWVNGSAVGTILTANTST